MELQDGDFDDSAFGEFLAGFPVEAVIGYVEDQPSPADDGSEEAA